MTSYRGAYIPCIAGSGSNHPDFYTIVKNNKRFIEAQPDTGLAAVMSESEVPFFHTYAHTFVARFGLALLKFCQHTDNGELALVPLVPFDRTWDDEALAELIGLTPEELTAIRAALPDYHGLLN